ncbi:uncharacterized protein [Procambarus clarkii]|uniref:uncharacterized protein n=1 Tax=Procambarus clarkii TaxID=6728 RepID=UPI00374494C0
MRVYTMVFVSVVFMTCGGRVVEYQLLSMDAQIPLYCISTTLHVMSTCQCAMKASMAGVATFGIQASSNVGGLVKCALAHSNCTTTTLLIANNSAHTVWTARLPDETASNTTTPASTTILVTPAITTTIGMSASTTVITSPAAAVNTSTTLLAINTTASGTTALSTTTAAPTSTAGGTCHQVNEACTTVGATFIHPTDCAKYLECSVTYVLLARDCGTGTHWKQSQGICGFITTPEEQCTC